MRVVSLACSNTEIVAALGCADLLVGVDSHSDWPEDVVGRLPRLGPDLEIDIDAVRALEPDLVLATLTVPGHETVVEGLEAAGLPFIAPSPGSLEEVYDDIRLVARRLGVEERAGAVVAEMRRELDPEAADLPPEGDRPRILVQWWPKPVIAPGAVSWTDDVIRAAGGVNVLGHEEVRSRPVTDEEVREMAPEAVVLSWCGVHPDKYRPDVIYGNEAWAGTPALVNRQVHCVPEAYLGRPGPRLVEGVRSLRRVVEQVRAAAAVP